MRHHEWTVPAARRTRLSLVLLLLALPVMAGTARLEILPWPGDTVAITNYVVSGGTNAGQRLFSVNTGTNLFVTVTNLPAGTNYLFVEAVSSQGVVSDASTNTLVMVPKAPGLKVGAVIEQSTEPGGPWTELVEFNRDVEAAGGSQFFRVKSTIAKQ